MTTAIVTFEKLLPTAPLQTIQGLHDRLQALEQVANIVTPVCQMDNIPPMHAISLRAVKIEVQHDVYHSSRFCQKDERALGGRGLQKIINAAGANILYRRRLDDRSEPFYCEIEVCLAVRDYDGVMRTVTKAKELDFRDGCPDVMVPEKDSRGQRTGKMVMMEGASLSDKRRHIQSLAETEALYRCTRSLFNLRQKFTTEELKKPFIVPKLVVHYDLSDPEQKKAAIEQAARSELLAFGQHFVPQPSPLPQETRVLETVEAPSPKRRRSVLQRLVAIISPTKEEVAATPEGPSTPPAATPEPAEEAFVDVTANVPEAPKPPIHVCGCPCGCQVEITPVAHTSTVEVVGAPRCVQCFPGTYFNYEKHKDVADLCLPKRPGMNAETWIEAMERRRAAKGAGQ